jgi:hypothetical protein
VRLVILLLKKRRNYECWNTLWLKAKNSCKPVQFNWRDSSSKKNTRRYSDHEIMTPEDIEALKTQKRCLSPYLRALIFDSYTPARKMIAAGLPLALATDYNPGSTPSGT